MKIYCSIILLIIILGGCIGSGGLSERRDTRQDILINDGWETVAIDTFLHVDKKYQSAEFKKYDWQTVDIPHNRDDYAGYRRLKHGNLHGSVWYKKTFTLEEPAEGRRYFLWFEGVGSYATVWLNGDSLGYHAGGRTSFTIDITESVKIREENLLVVKADHPENIRDLPWVCGGCSPEWGFSEGSQPFGVFRPVHLLITNQVRIEPFGVHIWNDNTVSEKEASLNISTEVKNYGTGHGVFQIINVLKDKDGNIVGKAETAVALASGQIDTVRQVITEIENPHLWSPGDQYLYQVETKVVYAGKPVDCIVTSYGIRWIKWDINGTDATNRFYVNGKPVFINGIGEYEHMFGQSHAFTDEQIAARVAQIKAAGFNAFRDAHQPHNLRYQKYWDETGMLWWTQMAAHIWFDTPEFRRNFKLLLHDWVKERRNNPSLILWGLENESTLPTDFARECSDLIRKLDPTASSQRLITTCNGGTGTDWNVIQNWSGTYGGNPDAYAKEISEQLLNGEYGAWRSLGLHTEGGFDQNGPLSEDRMTLLLESKIKLAESVRDKCCGQFLWLFNSHDNPGRVQSGEGSREIDRIGPVNYKGLFTIWGEPLDAWYMYRANYAPKETEPMVYIVSHSWPDRWISPGVKSGIIVYSNCDEVELFNGFEANSLGVKTRNGIGTHFEWDNVEINNNILYAIGYVDGKQVAADVVKLNHLPPAGNIEKLYGSVKPLIENKERNYLYLVNCGGPDYTDHDGNLWHADVHKAEGNFWGSSSWTDDYKDLPAFYGSQRQSFDPVKGTSDQALFHNFRYGRHKLHYEFPVPNGEYRVELFFTEPWYGTGGGVDCTGWRIFDVAANNNTVLNDLDIWKEVGHDQVLKKVFDVVVENQKLEISFPQVKAGQAVISAIAVSSTDGNTIPAPKSPGIITDFKTAFDGDKNKWLVQSWMNTGIDQYSDTTISFYSLPAKFYGSEWICPPYVLSDTSAFPASFRLNNDADVCVVIADLFKKAPDWLGDFMLLKEKAKSTLNSGTDYKVFQKRYKKGEMVVLGRNGKSRELPRCTIWSLYLFHRSTMLLTYEKQFRTMPYHRDVLAGQKP